MLGVYVMRSELALFSCLFCTQASFAAEIGNWKIGYFPTDRSPSGCIMGATYTDGTRVSVIVSSSYEWV